MKSRALAAAVKRKEEYPGARIPRELKDKVIKSAVALRMPVSVLIRKQLDGAYANFRLRADGGKNLMTGVSVTMGLPVRGAEYIVLCEICSESL